MHDLESINSIIKSTRLDTAIISSIIFILYTLIVKAFDYFKSQTKNKVIVDMGVAIREISLNINSLNTILVDFINDSTRNKKDRTRNSIEFIFGNFEKKLFDFCFTTIIHNNIDVNKTIITQNIQQTINAEYYKIISSFVLFDVNVNLKESWRDELSTDLLNIIYNTQSSESRINMIKNKLSIRINDYSTYVLNKTNE